MKATGYITDAENKTSCCFSPDPHHPQQWWQLKTGYTWKTPNGKMVLFLIPHEPVRHVTKNDAEHYAVWLGRDLPTELEWEYAAKANSPTDTLYIKHLPMSTSTHKRITGKVHFL